MRSAARQPADDPAPERADLDARAAELLSGQMDLVSRAQALIARCPDPGSASLLRQLLVETVNAGIHAEELRGELARYAAANGGLDRAFAAGRAYERALAAKAAVPGPRHRRNSRQPGQGQVALFAVKLQGIAVAAVVALKPLLPHLRHAGTALKHSAAAKALKLSWIAAHPAAATAGGVTVVSLAAAAAFVPSHPVPARAATAGTSASVPGWHTSAVPIPSSVPAFPAAVHPKAKHAARGKTLSATGLPVPVYPGPAPSSSPVPSSPASSAPSGPATLTIGTTSLTLTSAVPQAAFTVSASGGGWVSWKVDTAGSDLEFSPDHGVLQAGQQVTVTVSLAPASSLDALTMQVFDVNGQSVTVSLPSPAAVPTVLPTGAASAIPSVLPSL